MHLSSFILILAIWLSQVHNIHLTYGKAVIEDGDITVMISFFMDDFELMLTDFHQTEIPVLRHDGDADSLLNPYLRQHFVITQGADTLDFSMLESGIEADMCFYILFFDTDNNWKELNIQNSILFEEFSDQKNLLRIESLETGQTWSFYHVEDADTYSLKR